MGEAAVFRGRLPVRVVVACVEGSANLLPSLPLLTFVQTLFAYFCWAARLRFAAPE
jgi:hypothetical protein